MTLRIAVRIAAAAFLCTALSTGHFAAQEPGAKPETPAPAPKSATTQTTASGHPVDAYWTAHDKQLLTDFGDLQRYKQADVQLGPPRPDENRVVFMGDSITDAWHFSDPGASFAGKPYVNRGISGQTTPQMLVRFRQDVIDLQPKVVVLLAGTNDIAGNTGPMTLHETENNLMSMADLAAANHIRVVLCSILPAFDYPWHPGLTPAPKIDEINAWMKNYAAQKGYVYVDYHSAMKDARDGLPSNLSHDGVHPNAAGHAIMAPLVEAGIQKALAQ